MMSNATAAEECLNNPAWYALTNQHAGWATGDGLARRYPRTMTGFAAVATASAEAFRALAALVPPQEVVGLWGCQPPAEAGWLLLMQISVWQMVYTSPPVEPPPLAKQMRTLTANDLPAILPLIEATRPGPFQPQSLELGHYLALWEADTLAAMAGERMHLPGYREISTVCTHPTFQRRGYARQLTQQLIYEIQSAGETPFLHVFSENKGAQALYESLGFQRRVELPLFVLKRQG